MPSLKKGDYILALLFFIVPAIAPVAVKGAAFIFPVLGLAAIAAFCLGGYRPRFYCSWPVGLLGAMICLGAASWLWSDYPADVTSRFFKLIVPLVVLYLLVPILADRLAHEKVKRLWAGSVVAGFIVGVVFLGIEKWFGMPVYRMLNPDQSSYITSIEHAKPFTQIIFFAFPFVLSALFLLRGKSRLVKGTAVSGGMILLGLALSLGQVMAVEVLFVIAVTGALMAIFLPWNRALTAGAVACLVAVFVFLLAVIPVLDGYKNYFYNNGLNSSVVSRIETWALVHDRALEKPVLGWGLDSSKTMEDRGDLTIVYDFDYPVVHRHPHNAVIQIFYELGGIGTALLFAFCISLIVLIARTPAQPLARRLILMQFLLAFTASLPSFSIWQGWFVASLCLAALLCVMMAGLGRAGDEEGRLQV